MHPFPYIDALAFVLLFLYKISLVLSGTLIIYMGYRLFHNGITQGGAQEFRFGKWFTVHGGGPGIAFAALGCTVLLMSIWQKSEYVGAGGDMAFQEEPMISMLLEDPEEWEEEWAEEWADDDATDLEELESPHPAQDEGSP